ncbi:unnamed protein product, partial [marine sediment metagenome]
EPRGAEPLMVKLHEAGIRDVKYPERGDVFEL